MILKKLLLLMFVIISTNTYATIKVATYSKSDITAKKHEVVDIIFKNSKNVDSPFEVSFNATFTSPSGKKQVVPAFYNGGKEWIVRFSTSETGSWSYTTESVLRSFDQKRGKITISNENYNQRKGSIIANPNDKQHLIWEDGSPYFLLGFECDFLFALDYHNENPTRLNHFLDKLEQYKFNHIVMNAYANDVTWDKDPKLKAKYNFGSDESIFPFLGSNSKPDHSSLNVDFFKHFDRTIEALNDRNMISHLMIYVWNKKVKWPKTGSKEDNRYFDYVVKRYQGFTNIVWDISKEALLYGIVDDDYINERIDRLKKLDSYKRMVTVHDIGYCNRHADKIDMASNQDWKLTINANMLSSGKKFEGKPVLNVEHGGYEQSDYEVFCGNYINAEECLRRNYECIFAGSYTTYYWQGCAWNVFIYDWDTNPEVEYRPKMHYFKHLGDFFEKYPYHTFTPDTDLNQSGFCMCNDAKDTYLFYMPCESYKTTMNKLMSRCKKVSIEWFNTITGEYTAPIETTELKLTKNQPHPWHMKDDAILILKVLH